MTTLVFGSSTKLSGDFSFVDETGFLVQSLAFVEHTGNITVAASAGSKVSPLIGAQLINPTYLFVGNMTVDATLGSGDAMGFDSGQGNISRNNGLLTVASKATAYGFRSPEFGGGQFDNFGGAKITGDTAYGVLAGGVAKFNNTSAMTVTATGASGSATGAYGIGTLLEFNNTATLTVQGATAYGMRGGDLKGVNSGTITVESTGSGAAYGVRNVGGSFTFDNSGSIEVKDKTAAIDSVGVSFGYSAAAGTTTGLFTNSGTITGDYAVRITGFDSTKTATFTNTATGVLNGIVDLSGPSYTVSNKGVINGDLVLGFGKDVVDNSTGTITGKIKLGGGADKITLGAGDDYVDGGSDTDTAVIKVNQAEATITAVLGGYLVKSTQGNDLLLGVETIQFNDGQAAIGKTTITVKDSFTLKSGEGLSIVDMDGFILDGSSSNLTLTNGGSIFVADSAEAGGGSHRHGANYIGSPTTTFTFDNQVGAQFIVSTGFSRATGLAWTGGETTFKNAGLFQVSGGWETYGLTFGSKANLDNSGVFKIDGNSYAFGIDMAGGGTLKNSGQILLGGTTPSGFGIGVQILAGGSVDNSGSIIVKDSGNSTSRAVSITGAANGFTNSGVVEGDLALTMVATAANMTKVVNAATGKITGNIELSSTVADNGTVRYDFTNEGDITGRVQLSDHGNVFAGEKGHVFGSIWGGLGSDTIKGGSNDDVIFGGPAFSGVGKDVIYGNGGNDQISGGGGDDQLFGGDGGDTLDGNLGANLLDGGDGVDTASYSQSTKGVKVDLGLAGAQSTGQGTDTLISIESLIGSHYNDQLIGNGLANTLNGSGGDDTLIALGGDDFLFGGDGNDFITGGDGADTIDGGKGYDTVAFDLLSTEVTIKQSGADWIIDAGVLGIDKVSGVEAIRFKDKDVHLPVKFNETISVASTFTVGKGQTFDFVDVRGFDMLDSVPGPSLFNEGDIKISVSAGSTSNIRGIGPSPLVFQGSDGPLIHNKVSGTISVSTEAGTGDAFGIGAQRNATIINDGVVTVAGSAAYGVISFFSEPGIQLTNNGTLSVTATKAGANATGIYMASGVTMVNTGDITVTGAGGQVRAVMAQTQWDINNSGTIKAIDTSDPAASTALNLSISVISGGSGNFFKVVNSGLIEGGTAIVASHASLGPGTISNTSTGKIVGDIVLGGAFTVTNVGSITGDITSNAGALLIVNKGNITGDVRFADGVNNTYKGDAGSINGTVYGGNGNDTLVGGKGAEVFSGGAGNDTIYGDAGVDTVLFDIVSTSASISQGATAGSWVVKSSLGLDTLQGIETLKFQDKSFTWTPTPTPTPTPPPRQPPLRRPTRPLRPSPALRRSTGPPPCPWAPTSPCSSRRLWSWGRERSPWSPRPGT